MAPLFNTLNSSASGETGETDETCPNPCQCQDEASSEPIRYANGEIQMSVADVWSNGFGMPWGHRRTYSNQLKVNGQPTSVDYGNGFNWLLTTSAYLIDLSGDASEIQVVITPRLSYWFDLIGGEYVGAFGALQTLVHVPAEGVFRLSQPDGSVWVFHDFEQTANPPGLLAQVIAPGGEAITLLYPDASSPVAEMQRSYLDAAGVTTVESFLYEYLPSSDPNAGRIAYVTLRRNIADSGWDQVRRAAFTYYDSGSTFGTVGDLRTAVHQAPVGAAAWADFETYYYRYYLDSAGGTGFAHGLKYVLEPEAFRRLSEVADPFAATDGQVAAFADYFYQYDAEQRVVAETVAAGTRGFQFGYTTSNNPDGYNSWRQKTVETLPDGNQNIVFTNHIGQVMLSELRSGSDSWVQYRRYDEILATVVLRALPSAVQGYNEAQPDLGGPTTIVKANAGKVFVTDYYTTTTATPTTPGGATGYEAAQKVQRGRNGAPILLSETTYFQRSTTDDDPAAPPVTVFPIAQATLYTGEADGGTHPVTTSFAYVWHFATVQLLQRTTTLPAIPTAQNGSGSSALQREQYDLYGNMLWEQGPRGFIDHFTYDVPTGGRLQRIEDVNPALLTLPAGWSRPAGLLPPLNLVTDYEVDDLGRTTQILGPQHSVDGVEVRTALWTVYLDAAHEVRRGQGYVNGIGTYRRATLVNPVAIDRLDHAGRTVDAIQAARATAEGRLTASDCFPQGGWTRWTQSVYDDADRLIAQRAYHTIPIEGSGRTGANFDEAQFGYDVMNRRNRTVTPGGTITRLTFDPRGLKTGRFVGTLDGGATDADPTGGAAAGNNLVQVTGNVYDGGASGGDGNLTQQTQFVDASGTNDRVTDFGYDWRDRRTSVDGELEFFLELTHDNLDRVVQVDQLNDTENGQLLGRSQTFYDDQGRVYQAKRYSVNPSNGALGNALVDNNWYDEAGNLIKRLPAGSQQFVKSFFDSQARKYAEYRGYYIGGGTEPYAEVGLITSSNKIFEQWLAAFDDAGNRLQVASYQRFHNATGNGALNFPYSGTQPLARVSYSATWYDGVGRATAEADYGTNGDVAFVRPATVPARSDDVLVTSYDYDPAGNRFQAVDPMGVESRQTFNALGKVLSQIGNFTGGCPGSDADATVRFAYNGDGNVVALTAVNPTTGDQTTRYVYGVTLPDSAIASNALLAAVIYPDSIGGADQVTQSYNRQAQIVRMTDQNGTTHEYRYDLLGRATDDVVTALGTGIDGAVRRLGRSYDVRGLWHQLTSYADTGGTTVVNQVQNQYDGFRQPTTQYQAHDGAVNTANTPNVQYGYADGGTNTARPTTLTYPNGRVLTYDYGVAAGDDDRLSRIESLDDAGSVARVAYTYLGLASFVKSFCPEPQLTWTLIGGSDLANPYVGLDRFGRTTDCKWTNSSSTVEQIKYGYNRASSRIWRREMLVAGNDELYSYDGLERLVDMSRGNLAGGNATVDTMSFAQQWRLDATGNWSGFLQTDVSDPTRNLDQRRTSNRVNEITALTRTYGENWVTPAFDRAGNMTTMPKPATPQSAFTATYDAWNRLVGLSSDGGVYAYDVLNRRTKQTAAGVTRHYYYSADWQVVEERLGNSPNSAPAERQFLWGLRYIDDLVLRDRSPTNDGVLSERLYSVKDANWNITAVVNTSGAVLERYRYTAYGEPEFLNPNFTARTVGGDIGWEILYSGYVWDSTFAIYVARFRYLHYLLGTWLSRDPIGYAAGDNLHRYVSNSPYSYSDPYGLEVFWAARDLDGVPVGNHGFLLIIPDNPGDFAGRTVPGFNTPLMTDVYGNKSGFTLGGHEENDRLVLKTNQKADVAAVREYRDKSRYDQTTRPPNAKFWTPSTPNPDKYKSGWSLEVHKVAPPAGVSDTEFINRILDLADAYLLQTRAGNAPEYGLASDNCQSWVNSLLEKAGVSSSDREKAGEFSGWDWAEERVLPAASTGKSLFERP
ncbi:MAG: RHS repeat-associated core domain-containing protein [Planctomycetes bacterium]|nr:RHS repeat-associated core domain-containing protein [Planctomycetota bacterium]